ncbi:MAG: branched-chain amino acid ABC transporter permease [Burkholderiales bacterium]
MIRFLLSADLPRSRMLAALLALVLAGLALAPFVFPGTRSLDVAAKIAVFVVLAASYDLLLGYTGVVSFAHTMFFGIGGYGIGLAAANWGSGWVSLAAGSALALLLSAAVAFAVGLLSLRVRAIFFAMITLAVAAFFQILASQMSWLTGGEDGINFSLPRLLHPRLASYYLVLAAATVLFLALLRIVNSPFGRVLLSIRENEFRAEALGTRTVYYRTVANCIGALGATAAGLLYAVWLRYTGPAATLSFDIMVDILLMVVIGGMGTMYGSVLGATIFVLAQSYLRDLMKLASGAVSGVPLLPGLLHPDRWLLWLGVLFILCVYYFPTGIVGRLRK